MPELHEAWFPTHRSLPLIGAHGTTLLGSLPRLGLARFRARCEEHQLEVDAGTRIRVRRHLQSRPGRPGAVIVHGLIGNSDSDYVTGLAMKLSAAGFHTMRPDLPNCGGTEALTDRAYEGGSTAEVLRCAESLVEEHGASGVHLIGFSLGGNNVLKLAAELGSDAPWLRTVVAMSPAIDYERVAERLHSSWLHRLYEKRFINGLLAIAERREKLNPGHADIAALRRLDSIRAFDDAYTARQCGYRDVADYYQRASARARLGEIRVPTLVVAAEDDPIVPFELFRDPAFDKNEHLRLESTPRGGHQSFLDLRRARSTMWFDPDHRWAENRAAQVLVETERIS